MLEVDYFRRPAFSGSLVVAFAAYFGVFSIFFLTALYLQMVLGYTAFRHGLALRPHGARDDPGLDLRRAAGWPDRGRGCPWSWAAWPRGRA